MNLKNIIESKYLHLKKNFSEIDSNRPARHTGYKHFLAKPVLLILCESFYLR